MSEVQPQAQAPLAGKPIEVTVAAALLGTFGLAGVVEGFLIIALTSSRADLAFGLFGIIFGVLDLLAAWWVWEQKQSGGGLGFILSFLSILIIMIVGVFTGRAVVIGDLVLDSLAILLLLKAWPFLK